MLGLQASNCFGLEQPWAAQKFLDKAMKGDINSEQAGRAARFLRTQNLNVSTRRLNRRMSGDSDLPRNLVGNPSFVRARGVESSEQLQSDHPDVTIIDGETVTEHGLGAYGIMTNRIFSLGLRKLG